MLTPKSSFKPAPLCDVASLTRFKRPLLAESGHWSVVLLGLGQVSHLVSGSGHTLPC